MVVKVMGAIALQSERTAPKSPASSRSLRIAQDCASFIAPQSFKRAQILFKSGMPYAREMFFSPWCRFRRPSFDLLVKKPKFELKLIGRKRHVENKLFGRRRGGYCSVRGECSVVSRLQRIASATMMRAAAIALGSTCGQSFGVRAGTVTTVYTQLRKHRTPIAFAA